MSTTRPVLVLQHLDNDGPGHLATWLAAQGVPMDLRNTQAGQAFPASIDGYRSLAILGGEMSANDPLPSLRSAEALIREAVGRGVPVIGHCLGGQLMARALGASVHASPRAEIGWHAIEVADAPLAREWFGAVDRATVFQWHAEAFDLPPGATRLAGSDGCPHQAFALGPHLAMQFHIEVDAAKLEAWSHDLPPAIGAAEKVAGERWLAPALALAERFYARWLGAAG